MRRSAQIELVQIPGNTVSEPTGWPGRDKSKYPTSMSTDIYTFYHAGCKGRGVDHVKVATVMTVEHAYTVRISQSLGGLGKRSSAVRRESVSKCKITGYCNCCLKFTLLH